MQDATDAGLARAEGTALWDALGGLNESKDYFTLAEALDEVATTSGLRAVRTRGLPWVAVETDEQLEFTKISVLSPRFQGVAPFEVHIVRKSSSRPAPETTADREYPENAGRARSRRSTSRRRVFDRRRR